MTVLYGLATCTFACTLHRALLDYIADFRVSQSIMELKIGWQLGAATIPKSFQCSQCIELSLVFTDLRYALVLV
jgi:hypothetical protein